MSPEEWFAGRFTVVLSTRRRGEYGRLLSQSARGGVQNSAPPYMDLPHDDLLRLPVVPQVPLAPQVIVPLQP